MAHFFDEYARLTRNLEQYRLLTESVEKALKSSSPLYEQIREVEERIFDATKP